MTPGNKAIEQVRALCRCYPHNLTAPELVGRTFLILRELPGVRARTAFLVDHLGVKALTKLTDAASEVFRAWKSPATVDGFKLGAAVFPETGDASAVSLGDQLIPARFVKALMHCGRPAAGRSA